MPSRPPFSLNISASLSYRFGYVRNGRRRWKTKWRDHLILNSGLDKVAAQSWADCFNYMLLGTSVSPVPVRRDGGATTFTQAGTTLTASGNFFVASDVGRLFKFGLGTAGSEVVITGYASATAVTVGTSQAVGAASVGTVWYVNETALTSLDQATANYVTGAANNSSTLAGSVVTHKRTFIGTAVAVPKTFTEIAFSHTNTNALVFDRDVIVPGVSLAVGDQPLCVCVLTVAYSPTTPLAVANVGTGLNTSGQFQIEALGMSAGFGIRSVSATGATTGSGSLLEPSIPGTITAISGAITLQPFADIQPPVRAGTEISLTLDAYGAGTFTRTSRATFSTAQANHLIYGLGFNGVSSRANLTQKFTNTFTKTASQTWANVFRASWQRILSN